MSVNRFLLPLSDRELLALQVDPSSCCEFIENQSRRVCPIFESAPAITALIAEDEQDELAFLREGAPDEYSGWIGKCVEEDGRLFEYEIDMGYGPPWYCHHDFVIQIADKLRDVTEFDFTNWYDADWLDENHVYPAGWHEEGRLESTIEHFNALRRCILEAAENGHHLLIWSAC